MVKTGQRWLLNISPFFPVTMLGIIFYFINKIVLISLSDYFSFHEVGIHLN